MVIYAYSDEADVELDIGQETFASDPLLELIAARRRSRPGGLVAVIGAEAIPIAGGKISADSL